MDVGKPFHAVPPIGEPPKFLNGTHSAANFPIVSMQRLRQLKGGGSAVGAAAAADVLARVADTSRRLILELREVSNAEEVAFEAMRATFPALCSSLRN